MERVKKNFQLETVCAWLLGVIFVGVVVHAPLSVWLGTLLPGSELLIKSWKEILLLVAAVGVGIVVWRAGLWPALRRDKLLWLIAGYGALHLVLFFALPTDRLAAVAGLMIDLRYVLFFALVYIALRLRPSWRRPFLIGGAIGAAVVVGFAFLQALVLPPDILRHIGYGPSTIAPYLTIDQNPEYVRINSTLRGPNPLGAYAGIVLAVGLAAVVRRRLPRDIRWRAVLAGGLITASVALWASYSRSALVASVVALGLVLLIALGRRLSKRAWAASILVLVLALGGLFVARETDFVSHIILHEDPDESGLVNSNDEHFASLGMGTERLLRQPLGAGIGSTGSASLYGDQPLIIENQYLFIAHESGWLGLILFLAIFCLILLQLWRRRADYLALGVFACGVGLALIGLLLPVWADDTVSYVWWGLAGLALAARSNQKEDV